MITGIVSAAPIVFPKYGLRSQLVVAHAMAQFSHECGAGLEMVENINYSAERACQVWPSRFSSAADCYAKCDSFAGDPQFKIKLIDHVYGGRMGNKPYPSHDGSSYIGRGFAQTTGFDGYRRVKEKTGIDVLAHPEFLSDPRYALECGVADFILCGCLPFAEQDNVQGVTKHLNGGYIGLAERQAWLVKWKAALEGAVPYQAAPVATNSAPAAAKPAVSSSNVPTKTGGSMIAAGTAGAAAHGSGLPWWGVALIIIGVALGAWVAIHYLSKRKE